MSDHRDYVYLGISVSHHICADGKTSVMTDPRASNPGTDIKYDEINSRLDTRKGITTLVGYN